MLPLPLPKLRRLCLVLWLISLPAAASDPPALAWDPGMVDEGTATVSQPSPAPGQYFFRISTQSAKVWRTRLNVYSGEAHLHIAKGQLPEPGLPWTRSSARTGSDAIVLSDSDFAAGESWYVLVEATGDDNGWSLASGDPYVKDLGMLPFTDANGDGAFNIGEDVRNGGVTGQTMGPEGVAFFKVTLPPNVPAWSLWMHGAENLIGVRKNYVPALFRTTPVADRRQNGSLLLVPPYLGQGSDSYFVSVLGEPGSSYSMDSRIQRIEDMDFDGTVEDIVVADSPPYRVFRVEVPAEQVIWDLSLERVGGDPNICVRKQTVPAEADNDAFSEAKGEVDDSITLVSPELANGTWFVTVYGAGPYRVNLKSGTPVITDLGYRSAVSNDQPERSGWRYYRVPDIASQLGTLGWQLNLENAPQGTEIAIRRALAPGTWKKRINGATSTSTVRHADFSSANGILQRVDHEADIWYVGVYQPNLALGNFTLRLSDIVAGTGVFDGMETAVTDQIEGEWRYFRINVPEDAALLGWHVDITGVEGETTAKISVRRDRLPPAPTSAGTVAPHQDTWPSGAGWSQTDDFTAQMRNHDGVDATGRQFLAAKGPKRPLQPGTYYVGVLVGAAQPPAGVPKTVSYVLRSRGIGEGYSIPVTPLDPMAGTATVTNLGPRDFRFFSMTVPPEAQLSAWELRLDTNAGDLLFQVRRDSLPDFYPTAFVGEISGSERVQGGKRQKRPGSESLILLPEDGQAFLAPGTYFAAVVSEGDSPTTTGLGEMPASGVFRVSTEVPVTHLGGLGDSPVAIDFDLAGGGLAVYRVTVPAGVRQLEAFITNREGNPGISMIRGTAIPKPFPASTSGNNGYGWVGGQASPNHPVLLTSHQPEAGEYTVVVRANAVGANFPQGAGTLNFRVVNDFPALQVGGPVKSHTITDQMAESWQYFTLDVPESETVKGVYVTLRNVTSGLPRMVIRKGTTLPKDFTTTSGFGSDSPAWPDNTQWYQAGDFTGIGKNSAGSVVAGRSFLCAYGAPMGPGSYIIGVAKDSSVNTVSNPAAASMSYTIRVDAIGEDLDYDLTAIQPDSTAAPEQIPALAERDLRFYKVTLPAGMDSWRFQLDGGMPAGADGMVALRKDRVPSFDTGGNPYTKGGQSVKILGKTDHFALLPTTSAGTLEPGDYYLAVTSLGAAPTSSQTGAAPCDLILTTRGEVPATAIEPIGIESETLMPYVLGPAEIAAYEFTVPERSQGETPYGFVISISRFSGRSNFSARLDGPDGISLPVPPGPGSDGFSGGLASLYSSSDNTGGQIVHQATPGTYRIVVRSTASGSNYTVAPGILGVKLIDSGSEIPTLRFDGESFTVTNAGEHTDILQFRVIVPDDPSWKAWGVRIEDHPQAGKPNITVRRDHPVESPSGAAVNSSATAWPSLAQWRQEEDYTKHRYVPGPGGTSERERLQQYFVAARGRPLEPGTYYIGVDNRGTTLVSPRSFTLRTFAFGEGYTIPVRELNETGIAVPVEIEDPRMPAVYKISVPAESRGWAVSLTNIMGDFTLRVRKDHIPDTVNATGSSAYPDQSGGVHIQKAGDERFTLLPKNGEDYLAPGDYYLAVVSEGQNPSLASKTLGSGPAAAVITNLGPITAAPLGEVGESGLSHPIALEPAEVKFFTVNVPENITNLQFRLNDRTGDASIAVIPGFRPPAPAISESYGVFGGQSSGALRKDKAIVTLPNPAAGTYTVAVRAGGTLPSAFAPASAILSVNILKPSPLNFSASLNESNGFSHTDARSLADKEKYFYRVTIPPQIEGEQVLGWLVTLDEGSPIVRFYRSESEFSGTAPVTMSGRTALIVPPLLTFGMNWFIEVEGVGTTDYAIRSEPVSLTAAPWSLPAEFNAHAGDSSPGAPDGVGVSRELRQDHWDFYALDVPGDNLGLMRLVLEASNGNPNVYVRHGGIPTTDHRGISSSDILYQYKMISEDSEAGNFSEISNTTAQPTRLKPGRWYIGVKSDPVGSVRTSSRYRLKAHSGVVTDIDLTTAEPITGQNLAERDWRYYRVVIPHDGIPERWMPSFTRLHGTAQLYIRDTLPPFSYVRNNATSANTIIFNDWGTDARNAVASDAYVRAPAPGTAALAVPPLRPGATYYLGFYGASGGAFDVSSSISPAEVVIDAEMEYDTGSVTLNLPPNGRRLIRFHVPAEATRVKFDCVQSAVGVRVKLEQGAPPEPSASVVSHYQSAGSLPASVSVNRLLTTSWPFVPGQDYYILLSNTTGAGIESVITMKGVNAETEDEDGDGIPDAWERQYFSSHTRYNATSDPDNDGSTNLQEYLNGTDPTDASSVRYLVSVTALGGSASVSPGLQSHPRDTIVTLTAAPAAGDSFHQWSIPGHPLHGSTEPEISFAIQANIAAEAIFEVPLGRALDTPAGVVWNTSGAGAWYGQYRRSHDGISAASSPPIGNNTSAVLSTTLTGPGTLTFRWRVSSRPGVHTLALLIDNVVQPGAISGTSMTSWGEVTVAIPGGVHTVAWRYSKSSGSAQGEDRGWVDQVSYTGFPTGVADFAAWRAASFSTAELADPGISGPDGDPDRDGLANLLEAALGTGPKNPGDVIAPLVVTEARPSGAQKILRLESQVAASGVVDVILRLESTSDLSTGLWTVLAERVGGGAWVTHASTVANQIHSGLARDSVVFEVTVPESDERKFYRFSAVSSP